MAGPGWRYRMVAAAAGLVFASVAWAGALRVSNLVVTNSNKYLLVHAVLLGSLPAEAVEGLTSGLAASVRFQIEIWQHSSWWVDRRIAAKVIERRVAYDLLTKEYRVAAVEGEEREPYITRDIWEAERVLSEIRAASLVPVASLKQDELFYVRIRAEIRTGVANPGSSKIVPLLSTSLVETPWEHSPLLALSRSR